MTSTPLLLLTLASFALPLESPAPSGPTGPSVRAQKELTSLVEDLRTFRVAMDSGEGTAAARKQLLDSLDTLFANEKDLPPSNRMDALRRVLRQSKAAVRKKLRKGKVTEEVSPKGSFAGGALTYAYRTPRDYDPQKKSYPLILAIADADTSPADHIREYWGSKEVREGAIILCPQMPTEAGEWDQVTVNGRPGGLCNVLTALRFATEQFEIDPDRIFVSGHRKGVGAAMAAGNHSPQRFAGIVTRSSDLAELGHENFLNLPTLLCGGGARARAFAEACEATGSDNCDLSPSGKEEVVWAWMNDHQRVLVPKQVTVTIGDTSPNRVDWLRMAPVVAEGFVKAELMPEERRIELSGEGISFATIYLNDDMFSLDGEVTVVFGEREETVPLRPQAAAFIDLLRDGISDPQRIYTTQLVIDMRAGAERLVTSQGDVRDTAYDKYLGEAGSDPSKLWELHLWCQRTAREGRSLILLERLLAIDAEHLEARAALDLQGAGVREASAADRRKLDKGWIVQDGLWISPDKRSEVDLGRWLVDGEWLPLVEADQRHTRIDDMWSIPGKAIHMHSTANRATAIDARVHMERAMGDLTKVFGMRPELPLHVGILRTEEQYDNFAFGAPDGQRTATHAGRLYVVHSAYYAESLFRKEGNRHEYGGMGVCYWDAEAPGGAAYGLHSARLALGLSFVEALDPSPKAVRKARSGGPQPDYYDKFQGEKRLPMWLRYGAAVYGERFFVDDQVPAGSDPNWARGWSIENLVKNGGLRPLSEVFAFAVDPENRKDGLKLYIEAGLMVAFMVDGGCAPVTEEHARFKRVFAAGQLKSNHLRDLQAVLIEHEAELRTFAGL